MELFEWIRKQSVMFRRYYVYTTEDHIYIRHSSPFHHHDIERVKRMCYSIAADLSMEKW